MNWGIGRCRQELGRLKKNIDSAMAAHQIVAIALGLTVAAIVVLAFFLVREISGQRGSVPVNRRSSAPTLGLSPEWNAYLQWWITYLLMVALVALGVWWLCRLFGVSSIPYFWLYWPIAGSGAYYEHTQSRREQNQDCESFQPSSRTSFSRPFVSKLDELTRLLNGDRAQAERLAEGAGSADRAIAQLLRDRR